MYSYRFALFIALFAFFIQLCFAFINSASNQKYNNKQYQDSSTLIKNNFIISYHNNENDDNDNINTPCTDYCTSKLINPSVKNSMEYLFYHGEIDLISVFASSPFLSTNPSALSLNSVPLVLFMHLPSCLPRSFTEYSTLSSTLCPSDLLYAECNLDCGNNGNIDKSSTNYTFSCSNGFCEQVVIQCPNLNKAVLMCHSKSTSACIFCYPHTTLWIAKEKEIEKVYRIKLKWRKINKINVQESNSNNNLHYKKRQI